MKFIYQSLGILLFNGLLLALSLWIYFYLTSSLLLRNENPMGLDTLIITIVLVLGFIFFMAKEKFRKFIPGITCLLASLTVISFFTLNESLTRIGTFERLPIKYRQWNNSTGYLYYGFPEHPFEHAVGSEFYIDVDSLDVRIDRGLFGLKVITDNVKIIEMPRKSYAPSYTKDIATMHLETAEYLLFERRFSDAIDQYSLHLKVDSNSFEAYYGRGCIYQLKGQNIMALEDFLMSATIRYNQFAEYTVKETDHRLTGEMILSLVDSLESNNHHATKHILEYLQNLDKFDEYKTRIEWCLRELSECEVRQKDNRLQTERQGAL